MLNWNYNDLFWNKGRITWKMVIVWLPQQYLFSRSLDATQVEWLGSRSHIYIIRGATGELVEVFKCNSVE